jgi:hypothetical protein
MKLVAEDPFSSDHICLSRALNKVPSVVGVKNNTFFFHGLAPVWISQSIMEGVWKRGEYFRVQTNLRLVVARFAASLHAVGVDDRRDGDGFRREWRARLDEAGRRRDEAGASRRTAWWGLGGASGVDDGYRRLGESGAAGATGAGAADDRTTGAGVEGKAAGIRVTGVVDTRSGVADVEATSATGVVAVVTETAGGETAGAEAAATGAAGVGSGKVDVDVGEGGVDPVRKKSGGEERVSRVTGPGDKDREAEVLGPVETN